VGRLDVTVIYDISPQVDHEDTPLKSKAGEEESEADGTVPFTYTYIGNGIIYQLSSRIDCSRYMWS